MMKNSFMSRRGFAEHLRDIEGTNGDYFKVCSSTTARLPDIWRRKLLSTCTLFFRLLPSKLILLQQRSCIN
uniref:Uncharacterized protein n=1 Tax=Hyaloperonospora arabidopsidis (strain Emoy2) TaxID=559515 RepID=M4BS31_HYAAE